MKTLKKGKYRHYKGNNYEVINVAMHTETEELVVVYRSLYGGGELWVRPFDMFVEKVQIEGKWVDRFEFIGSEA